ncbi:unnamed protein product [Aureobasidium vineae]|uniref:Uncharacterized protein n=1 Tax=Aureobasidium vineae TaxID=2773715 RepID=A0A9N8PCG6_9PEZI|nr:unnamed protein product [Aureobasidium vineae]
MLDKKRWESRRLVYKQMQHEALATRRATSLQGFLASKRWERDNWIWRTHKPALYDDRVDHHCTACDKNRFLKGWWKEKNPAHDTDTHPDKDRYMCNACFANNWDLMVPIAYSSKLIPIFTSPEYPPLSKNQRPKAEQTTDEAKNEREEDDKDRHA